MGGKGVRSGPAAPLCAVSLEEYCLSLASDGENGEGNYKSRGPVNEVLPFSRIPDGIRSPNHPSIILNFHQTICSPIDQIRALPYMDTVRAFPLRSIPCRLFHNKQNQQTTFLNVGRREEPTSAISKSVPMIYHFFPSSVPLPDIIEGSRTPFVPKIGLRIGFPLFRALKAIGLFSSLR
jgi:hypothetical protein